MNETIFGTLSTTKRKIKYIRQQTAGVRHLNRLTPQAPTASDAPIITVTTAVPQHITHVECLLLEPATAVLPLQRVAIEWDILNWTYRATWQAALPAQPDGTLVRYQIRAMPASGGAPILADSGMTFSYVVGAWPTPPWAREAIVYQIFPDRFAPGSGRAWNAITHLSDIYGGTLRGIIEKLDYIADMGFNCLWLNPFFPDKTHHGYHATDHFSVNPRLGTLADMQELVREAHARGIRLLLDFVGNHVGSGHAHFQDALARRDSPYHDWFLWEEWPERYVAYFHVPDLPELNTQNTAVRQYMFDSVRYWLGEIGFDGLRIDYTLGPSHDFWTELRQAVQALKPDAWVFGETVDTPTVQMLYDGRFHGCLDFLLAQHLRDAFAFNTLDMAAFDAFLHLHEQFFPANFSRPSFLDNHDMNRFLLIAGNDKRKLKLAALCQFTLAGPPVVYNGTEVGVHQERFIHDPDSHGMEECRQPMLWGDEQDADLRQYFHQLAQLRREHPAVWQGKRQTVYLDAAHGAYAYTVSSDEEIILVAFNLSEQAQTLSIQLTELGLTKEVTLAPWSGDWTAVSRPHTLPRIQNL
ncbi:MAG: alpha-amylase [Chloroflexi bacterium]|nr:alpha-amylase [Chloroflexota bacterium]